MAMDANTRIQQRIVGLNCPACGGTLDLREGAAIEHCPFCDTPLLLDIPGNLPSYNAIRRLDREDAWRVVKRWLESRLQEHKAWRLASRCLPRLFEGAQLKEAQLIYAPFWVVTGRVIGLPVEDGQKPVDHPVLSVYPAYNVSELPVRDILLGHDAVMPFDRLTLFCDGMILKPTVPADRAVAATLHRTLSRLAEGANADRADILSQRQLLLYYPLWVIGYCYWGHDYRAIVDGTEPRLMAGQISDRLPKLVMMIGALGLLASFFGMLGFIAAAVIARSQMPKLTGIEPGAERFGPRLGVRWGAMDKTWVIPVIEPAPYDGRDGTQPSDGGEDLFWRFVPQVESAQTQGTWLVPLRCPTCEQALPVTGDERLFYCNMCRQAVEFRDGVPHPVEATSVSAGATRDHPHPFWIVTVRNLILDGESGEWVPRPGKESLNIYVPADALPFSHCLAQGLYLTRRQPRLSARPVDPASPARLTCPEGHHGKTRGEENDADNESNGSWTTCAVTRDDALRLARLIFLSLNDDPARERRRPELLSSRLVVFQSG